MVDANRMAQYYPIIKLWATGSEYRNFDFSKTKDRLLDLDGDNDDDRQTFFQQLKVHHYLSYQCHDRRSGDRCVLLLLSDYAEKSIKPAGLVELVLAIIGNIKPRPSASEMCKLIIFTRDKLENKRIKGINNKLNAMAHISWMNVLYQHFTRQAINLGPFCAPHEVMSTEAASKLISDLRCHGTMLPKIRDDDSQAIWIPAQPGDVIKITHKSHIAGYRIEYRYVISSKEIIEDNVEEEEVVKKEDDQQTEVGTELDADPEEFEVDAQSDRVSVQDQVSDAAESIAESDKDSDVMSEPEPEDPEDHDEDPEDDTKSAASIFESASDGESDGSGSTSDSDSESDTPSPSSRGRGRGRGRGQSRGRPRGTRGTRGSRGGRRGGRGGAASGTT